MTPLVFELSTTAFGRFRKVVEAAAAALLHDFGLGEKDSKKLAAGLCSGIKETVPKAGKSGEEIKCVIRRDGGSGTLELACGWSCDLSRTAAEAERMFKDGRAVAAVRLGKGKSSLILELRFPEDK